MTTHRSRTVLHKRSLVIGAWALQILVWIFLLALLSSGGSRDLGNSMAGLLLISVIGWLIWSLGRARVFVSGTGLVVRQIFFQWEIPWARVAEVGVANGVRIVLTDGRAVDPVIGQGSVLNSLMRDRQLWAIVTAIQAARPAVAPEDPAGVRRRASVSPWLLIADVAIGAAIIIWHHT